MLLWSAVGDRPLRRTFLFSAMLVFTLCGGGRGAAQDAPCPRDGHSAAVAEGQMLVFGGDCRGKKLGDFWALRT